VGFFFLSKSLDWLKIFGINLNNSLYRYKYFHMKFIVTQIPCIGLIIRFIGISISLHNIYSGMGKCELWGWSDNYWAVPLYYGMRPWEFLFTKE
jgi:hypothetical protein